MKYGACQGLPLTGSDPLFHEMFSSFSSWHRLSNTPRNVFLVAIWPVLVTFVALFHENDPRTSEFIFVGLDLETVDRPHATVNCFKVISCNSGTSWQALYNIASENIITKQSYGQNLLP